jgi:hypothetical protein
MDEKKQPSLWRAVIVPSGFALIGVGFLVAAWLHPYTDAGWVVNYMCELTGLGLLGLSFLILAVILVARWMRRP